jgi:hypothetical protein
MTPNILSNFRVVSYNSMCSLLTFKERKNFDLKPKRYGRGISDILILPIENLNQICFLRKAKSQPIPFAKKALSRF